jgi:hypothetical protein
MSLLTIQQFGKSTEERILVHCSTRTNDFKLATIDSLHSDIKSPTSPSTFTSLTMIIDQGGVSSIWNRRVVKSASIASRDRPFCSGYDEYGTICQLYAFAHLKSIAALKIIRVKHYRRVSPWLSFEI